MQDVIKKKFVLPVAILTIVGVSGAAYTIAHSGPTTAHAQTPAVQTNKQQGNDKETADDVNSSGTTSAVKQDTDNVQVQQGTNTESENGTQDTNSANEVEDGN